MKTKLPVMIALMVITLFASLAQAQFVQKMDSVYFVNNTSIKVVNTFTGNATTDTVFTKLLYSQSPNMLSAFATAYVSDGNTTTKTTKRVVTVSAGPVYYFRIITKIISADTAGKPVIVKMDTTKIQAALKAPAILQTTITPLNDGFRLASALNSGNDSAQKVVTVSLDSLFLGTYDLPDSVRFNSQSFASVDSAHGILSAYYWVKLTLRNKIKTVSKIWKVTKPQAPTQAYVTKDSVSTTTTTATVYLKVVTYGLNTKVFVSYGLTSAYGVKVIDSLPGKQGESLIAINIGGLTPGTTYHVGVIVKNSMPGSMGLPDFTFTTDLYSQPFVLVLDSVKFSTMQNGLYVYYKGKVASPSTSDIYFNLLDTNYYMTYKSIPVQLTGSPLFVPGPFAPDKYLANLSGSDWLYGYSDQSDSVLVRISAVASVDELIKPLDFNGQYQLYDVTGKEVGGGEVQRGEMFSLKLRELTLSPGIYLYRIRSDKDQKVLSGKIGRW